MLSDKTLRIKFHSGSKVYFLQYLRSHLGRKEIMKRSTGNQESMRNIGQDRIRHILVPVCSPAEMAELETVLEKTFTHLASIEDGIDLELSRSHALRQSILSRAFSGRLVKGVTDERSVSEMLQEIATAKNAPESRRGRGRKRAA
jgi:type I restriction enzyme S subunit